MALIYIVLSLALFFIAFYPVFDRFMDRQCKEFKRVNKPIKYQLYTYDKSGRLKEIG